MKKYLLGFLAVVLAVGFSAFTKPAKNAFVDFYRFTYVTSNGFAQTDVQNEDKAHWGIATLVTSSTDFSGCDGTLDKACQIIVEGTSTVIDGAGDRVLKTSGLSGVVSITAALGSEANTYYVSGGTNVSNKRNKD